MRLVYESSLSSGRECLLMDAGGAVVSRVTFGPDGGAVSSSADHPLTGRWRRERQVLAVVGEDGEITARFNAEGLDPKGRRLLWGSVKVGAAWRRHALRELEPPVRFPSISLCVACKGRLHHLRETLPRNLLDNADYPNLEFVVLDYNSTDGLQEWIEREMAGPIREGRVRYFRTSHPQYFDISHAKNMVLRLAEGEIIGIVDADNFTGKGYAYYLADHAAPDVCLVGCRIENDQFQPVDDEGCVGRFALHRDAFYELGGMNEELVGWGYEDIDFYSRLIHRGYRCRSIAHQHATCIPHTDAERSKELEFPDTGRGVSDPRGTCFKNSELSKANLEAGKVVSNAGSFGCGGVRDARDRTIAVRPRRDPSLSVCIVCSGDDSSLRRTLPRNLRALRFYPELEVVVLSVGQPGLGGWLDAELGEEIERGRLVHYRLADPARRREAESSAHLSNLCLRLAQGEILCHVSPRHELGEGFATRLARRHHADGVRSHVADGPYLVARHLFQVARGLREDLPESTAIADLHQRIHRQWRSGSNLQTLAEGTRGDFGVGSVRRGAEVLDLGPHRFPRVSFVVCCFDRLEGLEESLPRNLLDNRYYPSYEFVLLDCTGGGKLSRWVRSELGGYLATERLVYRRHRAQQPVRPGEAKNHALRSAAGEVLCFVDADSLTGRDFAFHVVDRLREADFLSGRLSFRGEVDSGYDQKTAGRIAAPREVFERAGGFDERLESSRRANLELLERLDALGLREAPIDDRFLRTIAIRERRPDAQAAPSVRAASTR